MARPSPRNSSGVIDESRVYYFLTKHFGVSLLDYDEFIDNIELEKLSWIFKEHYKEEKQFFEVMAHTISVGYARCKSKKKIELFQNGDKIKKITEDERNVSLNDLKKSFGK